MNRPAVVIEPRRPLARREVIELAVRQSGRCACPCGEKLNALTEGVTDEHRIALALGGTNDLSNRELWRTPCAKAKTAKKDQPAIAKCNRIIARENGTRRERKAIPSRGFQRTMTRGFDGKVRLRTTTVGEAGAVGMEPQSGGMNQKDGADQ
jgi:hypothetical protein